MYKVVKRSLLKGSGASGSRSLFDPGSERQIRSFFVSGFQLYHATSHHQAREAAGAVQDVGCGEVPLYEDDKVHLPDIHDAGKRAEDSDCRYGYCHQPDVRNTVLPGH